MRIEVSEETNNNALKSISGQLELKYKYLDEDDDYTVVELDFALIGDYYVHKSILRQYNITSNCSVEADVICTKDGKWNVIKIFQQ